MPQATLTFNLPEEETEHLHAVHGAAAFLALTQIRQAIRLHHKHGVPIEKTIGDISQTLLDTQHSTGVEI